MSDRKEHNRTLTPPGNDGAAFTVIPTRVGMNISCNFVHYISQTCHFLDIGGGGREAKEGEGHQDRGCWRGGEESEPICAPNGLTIKSRINVRFRNDIQSGTCVCRPAHLLLMG